MSRLLSSLLLLALLLSSAEPVSAMRQADVKAQPAATTIAFAGGLSLAEWDTDGSGTAFEATSPTVEYTRGPDMGGGVGGLLYSARLETSGSPPSVLSPTLKYNLSNGRGDIVAQSNSAGALTWTASYEAYGKRTVETGENKDKQRANSKDEDPTGLLNEGFRYRDLETGVWLSRDPAGFVDGPNLYAYVKQNPWTYFDPKGLSLKVAKGETKKVEAFMKKHGVSGHTVKNDGKWFDSKDTISGSAKVTGATTDALTSEIIAKMVSSDREFGFKDLAGFEKNVAARKTGVETALGIKAQYSMGGGFQNGGAANGSFMRNGWMKPNAGKSYHEAIEGKEQNKGSVPIYNPAPKAVSEREFVCEHCGYRHFVTPFPAACALLLDSENRILLIRRGHEPGLGLLCVPGGVIEGGETAEEAVSRETREEVGLDIPASEFSYFASLPNRYPFQGYVWPTLDLFYLATVPSFADITPQASEVAGWEIRPLAEVDFSEFAFESNAEAIRRLHQKKSAGSRMQRIPADR